MLKRLLGKLKTPTAWRNKNKYVPSNGTTNSKLSKTKSQNCKCEPSSCKCSSKRRQQQQYERLILSQLRRRGADNISSVILF
ncbi:uncharacterized protein fok isoform X2 [Drosophila tropicalis]|uniref:uncharacterized protein fok isoform X2 n=1 Tax=Drosophila tropicalis TaxID=46794 RepID=UPI0035ABB23C